MQIPSAERPFLIDQRTVRKMYIAGIDAKAQLLLQQKTRRTNTKWVSSSSLSSASTVKSGPPTTNVKESKSVNRVRDVQNETIKGTRQNRQNIDQVAETVVRYRVSPNAGAAIATAALESYGIVKEDDTTKVIDRSKVRRAINRVGKFERENKFDSSNFKGIYFDGR